MLRILKISEIRKMQVACFMLKVHCNQLPTYSLDIYAYVQYYYSAIRNDDTIDTPMIATLCTTAYYTTQFPMLDQYYGTQ